MIELLRHGYRERFESDEEMLTAIKETYESLKDVLVGDNDDSLRNLLLNIDIL